MCVGCSRRFLTVSYNYLYATIWYLQKRKQIRLSVFPDRRKGGGESGFCIPVSLYVGRKSAVIHASLSTECEAETMVKFFSKKKKSDDATTSLMTEELAWSSSSRSSSRSREEERESRRMDREARRRAMDDRFAGSKTSKNSVTKQLSREERDAKDVKIGCCYKFGQFLVKTIHLIDAAIGIAFVVYGSLIMTQFDNPAMEAAIVSLVFGSIMVFTSVVGVIGFSTKLCKRCGLLLSAYTAPFIVCFYMFVIIALLASPDVYFDYLKENMSVMYLSASQIQTLRNLLPMFYIIIASLAGVEIMR